MRQKKRGDIKIVNPDWLWACAERWEHVDERLFPLTAKARASRIPPAHCSSPEHVFSAEQPKDEMKDTFADSINPLMSFTQEEIEIMDKEVEEDMEDQDIEASVFDADENDLEDNVDEYSKRTRRSNYNSEESSNDDDECMSSKKKKKKLCYHSSEDEDDDDDDDDPVTRFRRGEDILDEFDLGDNSQDSVEDLEPMENEDDREWNAMGAALEREFLSE